MNEALAKRRSDDLMRPMLQTTWRFYLLVSVLSVIVAAGLGTWFYQMYMGFGMTGINMPIFWAFYITNFVFWIGISHAGTLISAILLLLRQQWRKQHVATFRTSRQSHGPCPAGRIHRVLQRHGEILLVENFPSRSQTPRLCGVRMAVE
jgi:hypothetical protein